MIIAVALSMDLPLSVLNKRNRIIGLISLVREVYLNLSLKKKSLLVASVVLFLVAATAILTFWIRKDGLISSNGTTETQSGSSDNAGNTDDFNFDLQLSQAEDAERSSDLPDFAVTPSLVPTAVSYGTVSGKVNVGYYFRSLAGITVKATGGGFSKTATTGNDGSFYLDNLPIGFYKIYFEHPDYDFNVATVQVNTGDNSISEIAHGNLKNFQPLNVVISVFSDNNGNGIRDGEERNLGAVMTLYKKSGNSWLAYKSINVDDSGTYSLSVSELGEYKIEPNYHTFYTKPGAQTFVVDGYGGNRSFSFGYVPTVSSYGFIIYVFDDKNENSARDYGEEYINYQYASITSPSGDNTHLAINSAGSVETQLEYGVYTIQLVPENSSWEYYYKITKGTASVNVTQTSGQQQVELGAHKLY